LINNIDGSNLLIIYIPQTNKSPKKSAISINHLYYADDFEIDEEEKKFNKEEKKLMKINI
jgi:hypothetical protein